jgi:hypothetical protein
MAFWFKPGGPQGGAAGALALVAGLTTLAVPGAALAAGGALSPDHARLPLLPATLAMGGPVIPNPLMRAGGLACAMISGRGWAQLDGGRRSL